MPKNENTTHVSVTTTYASRRLRAFSASCPKNRKINAPPNVSIVDAIKASSSSSWNEKAIARQQAMKKASMKSNEPRIFDMMRKLINLNFFRYDVSLCRYLELTTLPEEGLLEVFLSVISSVAKERVFLMLWLLIPFHNDIRSRSDIFSCL